LVGLNTAPDISADRGGTPDRDGAYRLWSDVILAGCCEDGKIRNLEIQSKQDEGGTEFGLPGSHEFGPIILERIDDSTFKFQYEFYGSPNQVTEFGGFEIPTAEFGLQLVRSRTSTAIWHLASGTITCDSGDHLTANLTLYGSNFPTHELYVNGSQVESLQQDAISELWKPLPSDSDKALGVRP